MPEQRDVTALPLDSRECGWCHGTGIHYYNTDDMDRLTMPCPNRNCPRSPDWWHNAAEANAEDEAWEKRSATRDQ